MTAPDRTKWVVYPRTASLVPWRWRFHHVDYDGAPDSGDHRCGPTEADCWAQTEEMEEDA